MFGDCIWRNLRRGLATSNKLWTLTRISQKICENSNEFERDEMKLNLRSSEEFQRFWTCSSWNVVPFKKENASVTVRQPWNVAVISNHRSRKSNRPWKNELWLHRSVWLSHYTVLFTFCFKRRRKQNVNQRFGSWNREAQLGLISMLIAVNWMQTSSWSIELAGIVLNAQFNRSFLKTETATLSEIWRFIKFIHFAF